MFVFTIKREKYIFYIMYIFISHNIHRIQNILVLYKEKKRWMLYSLLNSGRNY
jgi:hypothetical protein